MTVKELKEKLEEFDEDDTITMEQEYNSNGGICNINDVYQNKYNENMVTLEIDYYG